MENKVNIVPLSETWEKVVPQQSIPEGLSSLSAEQCGTCHQDHYKEWKTSTHAQAWKDLQFQSELRKESSPFFCINCHTPLQNQQKFIVEGKIDDDIYKPRRKRNPHFDRSLRNEGITCSACHVRENSIIGPTGTSKAPHKTKKDPAFLSETLCISCHNANAVVTKSLACSFETGDEWKDGPFYKKNNCISCHMKEMEREVVQGYGKRKSHFHAFPGSGIPKQRDLFTHRLEGLEFTRTLTKKQYKSNEEFSLDFHISNKYAGHRVPTGDPERFILIEFELFDSTGKRIDSKTERIGERWQWHPVAKKLSDNNLNPGETRIYTYSKNTLKNGRYTLLITVSKHRIDAKNANYNKLPETYPRGIEVYSEEVRIIVK